MNMNNNRKMIDITLYGIAAMFFLLVITEGCARNDETPSSLRPITETNTTIAILPRETNAPSSTPRATLPTEIFTETPLPPTNTPPPTNSNQLLGRNSIVIMELGWDRYYLLDLDTGYMRMLGHQEEFSPVRVLSWTGNGCDMVVLTGYSKWSNQEILRVDLQGNILQNLLSFEPSKIIGFISLSPSEEWIAYRLSEGEALGGYDVIFEYENIEVISANGELGPYRLTHGNGGREVAWAPDSTRLAYGDFDENGVPQLYVSNLDGSGRVQLTQFVDPLVDILNIRWSPDGERIAFAYDRLGNISPMEPRKTDVMVIPSDNNELPTIADQVYQTYSLWWQGNDTLVVWGYKDTHGSTSAANELLFWVNSGTGQVTEFLEADTTPGGYMEITHPFGSSSRIGFFTAGRFYSYDPISGEFQTWDNVNLRNYVRGSFIIRDWISAPSSFQGEAACQP